jgi:hypothetical protein
LHDPQPETGHGRHARHDVETLMKFQYVQTGFGEGLADCADCNCSSRQSRGFQRLRDVSTSLCFRQEPYSAKLKCSDRRKISSPFQSCPRTAAPDLPSETPLYAILPPFPVRPAVLCICDSLGLDEITLQYSCAANSVKLDANVSHFHPSVSQSEGD